MFDVRGGGVNIRGRGLLTKMSFAFHNRIEGSYRVGCPASFHYIGHTTSETHCFSNFSVGTGRNPELGLGRAIVCKMAVLG